MKRFARFLACALLTATACSGTSSTTRAPRSTSVNATEAPDSDLKPAHDFTLSTFEGDTFTLSDHIGKVPVVLNFWAPW